MARFFGTIKKKDGREIEEGEVITAVLHPGICTDGKYFHDAPLFSLFGTDTPIAEFSLAIRVATDEKEGGIVVYTFNEKQDDVDVDYGVMRINLGIPRQRFHKLAGLISARMIDVATFSLDKATGFYSGTIYHPHNFRDNIKVLYDNTLYDDRQGKSIKQKIIKPAECNIKPPELGDVGGFNLNLTTRCKLNPRQNFKYPKITKPDFSEYGSTVEICEEAEWTEEIIKKLLAQIARDQTELVKLKTPVWLITILFGVLLLF